MILIVVGLILFETISSIDNAVINAEVLSTMSQRARRWFLIYGLFIAVFVVRGMLPWLIVWATNPTLGPVNAFTATFSDNPDIERAIEQSSPFLLVGGAFSLFSCSSTGCSLKLKITVYAASDSSINMVYGSLRSFQ